MVGMNNVKRPLWRRLARILRRIAVIVAILVGLVDWVRTHACPIEIYDIVQVTNSDWVVEKQLSSCAFAVDVDFIIQARNTRTQEVVIIAEDDDGPGTKVLNDGPNHVVIRVDNRTLLRPIQDTFGSVRVSYDYLPKDDPADRAAYQRWYYDQRSPENIDWACKNILAHMAEPNRQSYDEMLAYWNFRDSNRKSYCAQNR
jgi:hypothetical protein